MLQTESIKTLLSKIFKVQESIPTMPKDKQGYGYKYTELDTIVSVLKPILQENGVGFMQTITSVEGKSAITTRIFCTEGEYIEDTAILPSVQMAKVNEAQNMGAAITYMRRYALCSMFGITSDEDVDGNISAARPQQQNQPKTQTLPQKTQTPVVSEKDILLKRILSQKFNDNKPVFTDQEKKDIHSSFEDILKNCSRETALNETIQYVKTAFKAKTGQEYKNESN